MDTKQSKQSTLLLKKEETFGLRRWFILNASGKTLGRFASEVAKILRGKNKTVFTPHVDGGDGVIILNADKVKVTGTKEARKDYKLYSGFIGGYKEVSFREMRKKNPCYIIKHAVKGMMPKTRLTEAQMKRLRIFVDDQHDMQAQKPIEVQL